MIEKKVLHPRNPHRFSYDYEALSELCPELKTFISVNKFGHDSLNFSDPEAVKSLNKAILKFFYKISFWDIPESFLCPPIPGRADYIHYLADLLASYNYGKIPKGDHVKVLDIGVGANCIYPIIGINAYDWSFVGTDINAQALKSAHKIISENDIMKEKVELRLQPDKSSIFRNIIRPNEQFSICICNPPFHASAGEAQKGSKRKWKNLGKKIWSLNFGGTSNELWCEGGEKAFILSMIKESAEIPDACKVFTTLVSKKENLSSIYHALKSVRALDVKTIDMAQGQKISRFVAWRMK